MTFKPAHKQDNPTLKPGQTVYGFDRYPYLKSGSIAEPPVKPKLTFEEWLHKTYVYEQSNFMKLMLRSAWDGGQENK